MIEQSKTGEGKGGRDRDRDRRKVLSAEKMRGGGGNQYGFLEKTAFELGI